MQECASIIAGLTADLIVCSLKAQTDLDPTEFQNAAVDQVDARYILPCGRQAVARIRCTATIQPTITKKRMPLCLLIVHQDQSSRDNPRIIIGAVANRPAPITITGLVDTVVVGAVEELFFDSIATGGGEFTVPAIRPTITDRATGFNSELREVAARKAAGFVLPDGWALYLV